MHQRAGTLIAAIGTHVDPGLVFVGAVGCRRAWAIANVEFLLDAGQVAEYLAGLCSGIVDAVIDCLVTAVVIPIGHLAHGQGVELDDVAIADATVLGHRISSHIIQCGRLQILQAVDGAVIAKCLRAADVVVGRIRIGGAAKTTRLDRHIIDGSGALDATKGHRGTTSIAAVSHYGRLILCSHATNR